MKSAKRVVGGVMVALSLSACAASSEPVEVAAGPGAGEVTPERAIVGPSCLTTTPAATLGFGTGPYSAASASASYSALGCSGEYVVQLAHLDTASVENFRAGTSLYFKDGSYPATQQDCVNARLVATVYAYEGGDWVQEGKIAMHGVWVHSGTWSCAPKADTTGSDAVYFNPAFGFSAARVVASGYVLPYGEAFLPYPLPLGVDLF